MWLAGMIKSIKPWLSVFYTCLASPSLTLISVNSRQWANIAEILNEGAVATCNCKPFHFLRGWRVAQVGHTQVQSKTECVKAISFHKGHVWLRISQPRSKKVRVHTQALATALHLSNLISGLPVVRPFRPTPSSRRHCRR